MTLVWSQSRFALRHPETLVHILRFLAGPIRDRQTIHALRPLQWFRSPSRLGAEVDVGTSERQHPEIKIKMTFRNTYLQHILKLLRRKRGLIKSHISHDAERSYIRRDSRNLLLTDLVLCLSYPTRALAQTMTTMERSTQTVAALQTEIDSLRHELQTLQVDQKSLDVEDTITIADYLLNRLAENGVTVRLDPLNTPTPLY